MNMLEYLVKWFEELVDDAVNISKAGNHARLFNLKSPDVEHVPKDMRLLHSQGDHLTRLETVLLLCYNNLEAIEQEHPQVLEEIQKKVVHPFIQDCIEYKLENPRENEKEFVIGMSKYYINTENLHNAHMMFLPTLRGLIFLEIIKRHPETVNSLKETSVYYPERLFRISRLTIEDINRNISDIIIEIMPDEIQEIVPQIHDYVEAIGKFSDRKLGPYKAHYFRWKDDASPEKITVLYGEVDIKRQIYRTLAESLLVTLKEAGGRKIKTINSPFSISPTTYNLLNQSLCNYATNQMLYAFEQSKGTKTIKNFLTRFTRMHYEIKGENLKVTNFWRNSSEKFTLNEQGKAVRRIEGYPDMKAYKNSTMYLPLAVVILDRFLAAAKEYTRK